MPAGTSGLNWNVIGFGAFVAVLGYLAGATSPNPEDHRASIFIIGYAVILMAVGCFAPDRVAKGFLFGSIAIAMIVYALPKPFWKFIGLIN